MPSLRSVMLGEDARVLRWSADDLMPAALIVGAALGAWAFNWVAGKRPGRRAKTPHLPEPPAPPPGDQG